MTCSRSHSFLSGRDVSGAKPSGSRVPAPKKRRIASLLSLAQTPPELGDRKGLGEGRGGKARRVRAGSGIGWAPTLPALEGISPSWVSVSPSAKWGAGQVPTEWGPPEVTVTGLLHEMHHANCSPQQHSHLPPDPLHPQLEASP